MWNYLARRVVMSLLVLFGVSLLTFSMLHLVPGDPVHAILGRQAVSAETIDKLRAELGLNDPLPVQYMHFLQHAVHGDLGRSIRSKRPVMDVILEQLPSTIKLTLSAMFVAILIGIPLGVTAALNQNKWIDTFIMMTAISGVSIPSFWLGLILILIFAIGLGWLPGVAASSDPRSLILPALTLGLAEGAVLTRLVRASFLDVLSQQY
ncbi:MAG TPA: ABC transporter permease, partial [Anaerolineales bacterium]